MAWENIEERRTHIKQLIDGKESLSIDVMKKLSLLWNCSPSAIYQDIGLLKSTSGPLSITPKMKERIYLRDGRACQYCGSKDRKKYVVEHIIPRFLGGENLPKNLCVSCYRCNKLKGRSVWPPKDLDKVVREDIKRKEEILSLYKNSLTARN